MPKIETKPSPEDFERQFKALEDKFKKEVEQAYATLQQSLAAIYPDQKPEDFSKWKRPGWWDTWQQQGLSGLGRRVFHGSNPHNDYLTWKMSNLPKSESTSLHEYLIIKETCELLVDDLFEIDESVDEKVVIAVRRFKNTMSDIFTIAIHSFYNLGKNHKIPPEELGKVPEPEGPAGPTEGPTGPEGPAAGPEGPEDVDDEVDDVEANKLFDDEYAKNAEDQRLADEEAAKKKAEEEAAASNLPVNVEEEGEDDEEGIEHANLAAKDITSVPEEILKKLPIKDEQVEEIIQDYEDKQEVPLGEEYTGELRKLMALKLLADKIMAWVLESKQGSDEQILRACQVSLLGTQSGLTKDDVMSLNQNQLATVCKMLSWISGREKFNWMNPSEPATKRIDKNTIQIPTSGHEGVAAAALKIRFDASRKGLFERLVSYGYKPWTWFAYSARKEWPKSPQDATERAKGHKDNGDPTWNWPTKLKDKEKDVSGGEAFAAMVDLCTAIRCGDLFGHGEVAQNPSNTQNKDALEELTEGCYGSTGHGHASIMNALIKIIRTKKGLKDEKEVNEKIEATEAKEAIEQHANYLHRSIVVRKPNTVTENARRKKRGPGKGREHYERVAGATGLEGEPIPEEPTPEQP